jgi:hypothetical protein
LPDYLSTARKAIEDQISSLQDEVKRLEKHAKDLLPDGAGGRGRRTGARRGAAARRSTAARKTTTARKTTGARRGRPRGSGTRANQALAIVKRRPGASIPEIAKEMGIKQNYLYRVMPTLQKEKKVRKRGKGWHPA